MFVRHISKFPLLRKCHLNTEMNRFRSGDRFDDQTKRSRMLNKMLQNNDKMKHWHLQFTEMNVTSGTRKNNSIFKNISKPTRRENALNSLFMSNITDVMSTGEVAPDVIGTGIEIIGVRITHDLKTLNVYWQLPPSKVSESAKLELMLQRIAPRLRADVISRNLIGRMPHIFFVRDTSNLLNLAFQENLKAVESTMRSDTDGTPLMPVEELLDGIYKFSDSTNHVYRRAKEKPIPKEDKVEELDASLKIPVNPLDMKSNILGVEHEKMMRMVISMRKKVVSCPISDQPLNGNENAVNVEYAFSEMDIRPLRDPEKSKILKKFCKERQLQWIEAERLARLRVEENSMLNQDHNDCEDKWDDVLDERIDLQNVLDSKSDEEYLNMNILEHEDFEEHTDNEIDNDKF